jgi:hypothetical protein
MWTLTSESHEFCSVSNSANPRIWLGNYFASAAGKTDPELCMLPNRGVNFWPLACGYSLLLQASRDEVPWGRDIQQGLVAYFKSFDSSSRAGGRNPTRQLDSIDAYDFSPAISRIPIMRRTKWR